MCRQDEEGFSDLSAELLCTQALALSACTTFVSVDPKLTNEMRNIVMKATLGFFALPNDPAGAVNPLIDNIITLLCAILLTRQELPFWLESEFCHLIVSGTKLYIWMSGLQKEARKSNTSTILQGSCKHIKHIDRSSRFNVANLPSAFLLPSRDALCLGDRVIVYLPRCADTNSEVRKVSAQILDQFFDISLSLTRPVASNSTPIESYYAALSSPEDVIAILRKIHNEKARRYLSSMRKKPSVHFSHKFPNADPLALRLLERLLSFDPKDRPSAEDALADPYFQGLANVEREPTTHAISKLEFEFERRN